MGASLGPVTCQHRHYSGLDYTGGTRSKNWPVGPQWDTSLIQDVVLTHFAHGPRDHLIFVSSLARVLLHNCDHLIKPKLIIPTDRES